MKYFAILKDSLREALDSKVLYVLLGLSLVVMLFLATVSFHPLPAQKTFDVIINGSLAAIRNAIGDDDDERVQARMKKALVEAEIGVYQLEKIDVLRGTPDTPDADYEITISKRLVN